MIVVLVLVVDVVVVVGNEVVVCSVLADDARKIQISSQRTVLVVEVVVVIGELVVYRGEVMSATVRDISNRPALSLQLSK